MSVPCKRLEKRCKDFPDINASLGLLSERGLIGNSVVVNGERLWSLKDVMDGTILIAIMLEYGDDWLDVALARGLISL